MSRFLPRLLRLVNSRSGASTIAPSSIRSNLLHLDASSSADGATPPQSPRRFEPQHSNGTHNSSQTTAPSSEPVLDFHNAVEAIRSQPSQYVITSFLGRRYILSPRDLLTVPRMNDVRVGDLISLSNIYELGSREYTLRGNPTLPEGTVRVEARVVEHTKGRMEEIVKKKRRKGYKKTIKHKQTYTRLRIGSILVGEQFVSE